jgi:hypothetical protein
MSTPGTSRAADLAAQHVEQIVAAAEQAAEQIREQGRRDAERELQEARKQALAVGHDARDEAKKVVSDAEQEADQLREQTRRAVEGRVAAAEQAAAEVLEEAQTLSAGMRRLGQSLGNQAERMLRDVQAAHRRMQADLRVAPSADLDSRPARRRTSSPPAAPPPSEEGDQAGLSESERIIAAAEAAREGRPAAPRPRRGGSNPFDDLDVPNWVEND